MGIADVMVMRISWSSEGRGLRRGALSAHQAHGKPGVLEDGQRISAATYMQGVENPGVWWCHIPAPSCEADDFLQVLR
ncbi:hypothetical protein ACFVJ4_42725 [Streptomyces sp. NPDC127178]|uniref:hypothetical protein n=1 Tax=unclassified Streptomyces TaxID=2593676 RepID=UPI003637E068